MVVWWAWGWSVYGVGVGGVFFTDRQRWKVWLYMPPPLTPHCRVIFHFLVLVKVLTLH